MTFRKFIFLIGCFCAFISIALYVLQAMGAMAFAKSTQRILAQPVESFIGEYQNSKYGNSSGQETGQLEVKTSEIFFLRKTINVLPQCIASQNFFAFTFLVSITVIWFSRTKCQPVGSPNRDSAAAPSR